MYSIFVCICVGIHFVFCWRRCRFLFDSSCWRWRYPLAAEVVLLMIESLPIRRAIYYGFCSKTCLESYANSPFFAHSIFVCWISLKELYVLSFPILWNVENVTIQHASHRSNSVQIFIWINDNDNVWVCGFHNIYGLMLSSSRLNSFRFLKGKTLLYVTHGP